MNFINENIFDKIIENMFNNILKLDGMFQTTVVDLH